MVSQRAQIGQAARHLVHGHTSRHDLRSGKGTILFVGNVRRKVLIIMSRGSVDLLTPFGEQQPIIAKRTQPSTQKR
jgi:hypothetical protein